MGFSDGFLARVTLSAVNASTGNTVVNTLHYDDHDAVLPWPEKSGTMQALADRLRDAVLTPYKAMFTNAWQIQPVIVTEEIDPLSPDDPRDQALVSAIPMAPDLVFGASTTSCHWTVYSRTRRSRGLNPYANNITSAILTSKVRFLRSRGA